MPSLGWPSPVPSQWVLFPAILSLSCVFGKGAEDDPIFSSPPGFLSGLVQAAWCGTAKAGPCYVSTAQSGSGCSQRSVWRRAIRDQCFSKSSSDQVWTADEGSLSQLAGMVWAARFKLWFEVLILKNLWCKICCRWLTPLRMLKPWTKTSQNAAWMPSMQLSYYRWESCGSETVPTQRRSVVTLTKYHFTVLKIEENNCPSHSDFIFLFHFLTGSSFFPPVNIFWLNK